MEKNVHYWVIKTGKEEGADPLDKFLLQNSHNSKIWYADIYKLPCLGTQSIWLVVLFYTTKLLKETLLSRYNKY